MKMQHKRGYTGIYESKESEEPLVKVYNNEYDSSNPYTSEISKVIAQRISDKVLVDFPTIHETRNYISVQHKSKELVNFYWAGDDNWKYGIRNKGDALKLARHFIELYMMDYLPSPKTKGIEYVRHINHVEVYSGDELIATFKNMSEAERFYNDYCDESFDINKHGLKSHSSQWDRSIRTTRNIEKDSRTYCLLLMDYMDTWGRCD